MKQTEQQEFYMDAEQFLKNVAVDNVILGYHDKELKVLLQKPFIVNKWTITGGHIRKTESIEEAASRIALERTGLKDLFLEQFRSFGSPNRAKDETFNAKSITEKTGFEIPPDLWIFDYFVTVGFYTLTEFSKVAPTKGAYDDDCQWWPINELPPMLFNHENMIQEALKALSVNIAHHPIGYELLPEKFTLPQIHALYESILGKSLDDRNFSRKLLVNGILIKLKETKKIGAHRSPFLYTFDKEKYDLGLQNGDVLVF